MFCSSRSSRLGGFVTDTQLLGNFSRNSIVALGLEGGLHGLGHKDDLLAILPSVL